MLALMAGYLYFSGTPAVLSQEDPQPAPTNAAKTHNMDLYAVGKAVVPPMESKIQAEKCAHAAARLDAQYHLALQALNISSNQKEVHILSLQDAPALAGWLQTAKFRDHQAANGTITLQAHNGSWNKFVAGDIKKRTLFKKDLNNDGVKEEFLLLADSRINVVSSGRILGSYPAMARFEADLDTNMGQKAPDVYLSYPESISNVRWDNGYYLADLTIRASEMVNGIFVGTGSFSYPIRIQGSLEGAPTVTVNEPVGLSTTELKKVPLRGTLSAPAGVMEAVWVLNDKELWRTPVGFKSSKIDFDILMNLNPGNNRLVSTVKDCEGRSITKDWNIKAAPFNTTSKTRALVVGAVPSCSAYIRDTVLGRTAKVRQALIDKSYLVKTLTGEEVTPDNLRASIKALAEQASPGDRLLIYFTGPSAWQEESQKELFLTSSSQARDGQYTNVLDTENVAKFLAQLPPQRLMVLADNIITKDSSSIRNVNMINARWQCCNRSMYSFYGPGNIVLMRTAGAPTKTEAEEKLSLTGCLLTTLAKGKDVFKYADHIHSLASIPKCEPEEMPLLREF